MNDNYDKRIRKYGLINTAFEKLVARMVYALFSYGGRIRATNSQKDTMERRAIARMVADYYRNDPQAIKMLFADILELGDVGQDKTLIQNVLDAIEENK